MARDTRPQDLRIATCRQPISYLPDVTWTYDQRVNPIRRWWLRALSLACVLLLHGCISISPVRPSQLPEPTTPGSPTSQPTTALVSPSQLPPAASPTPSSLATSPSASTTPVPTTAPPPPSASAGSRPTFGSVDDAYAQAVEWHRCTPNGVLAECATVFVPTDYEHPALGTTAIAVAQFHTSRAPRGDLFVNPGGPGAAGIDFAAFLAGAAPILAGTYNLVGFDPRGTGQSDPLVCLDAADLDALNTFDPTPDSATQRQQGIELVDAQGEACKNNSGAARRSRDDDRRPHVTSTCCAP